MTANIKRGFTLIELLIVMAILGVLAVVVLVAINPAEQMRRARDTGRISGTQQIGRAIQAYFTANGVLPGSSAAPATNDVNADLTASAELSTVPQAITATGDVATPCTGGQAISTTWCYKFSGLDFIVYAALSSTQRINQCGTAAAFTAFSSVASRGGLVCLASGEPGTTATIQ